MDKPVLTREMETLYIPLFAKAEQMKRKKPLLVDKKAVEIANGSGYDFARLKIPGKTSLMVCLRARMIDEHVRDLLEQNPESLVLHLGCGLDSRHDRIGESRADWYDVDFPEVVGVRKLHYQETDRYHMVGSSVLEKGFLDRIPDADGRPAVVVAEGLLMYLSEDEVRSLLGNLRDKLGSYRLVCDVFSTYAARRMQGHPSIKRTGARIRWGIDRVEALEAWGLGLEEVREHFFTEGRALEGLGPGMKWVFKLAGRFPVAKKAHRVVTCFVGPGPKGA
ncbi:class I SAM-dependent methyltransferase [Anaerotalea alkaliphila]|uniref:Class I SAM-dependent methyltransferase n=1 Tax=Anaerotalea alkaliphila TaxID=2662126 RepID=A0A7X5KNB4_9FIRM|nr:class I SAM-dependent methyltransferase [Anaerotalea alkaliphila]NDL67859.1 class I SAM-dependent methyltransferase [Anaerotalea alkaliphila]